MTCGIINKIKKRAGSISKFVRFANVTYKNENVDFNSINCENFAYHASKTGNPTYSFHLIGWETQVTSLDFRSAAGCCYPTSFSLSAWDGIVWKQLCSFDNLSLASAEFVNYPCKASKYYSAFQLKQLSNSCNLTYIEFQGFELQGAYRRTKLCTLMKCRRKEINVHIVILVATCFV